MPAEGQILVNIEDMSLLKNIKKAINMVKGVGKITVPRRRMTSYERSLRDLDEGRVYEAKDVDDLFKGSRPHCALMCQSTLWLQLFIYVEQ